MIETTKSLSFNSAYDFQGLLLVYTIYCESRFQLFVFKVCVVNFMIQFFFLKIFFPHRWQKYRN